MDKSIIKNLGLTDYEVEIFLSLIKNGPLSAYEISKKTGLYRQACYDALNRLQEKGFVSTVLKNGKKIFQSINPKQISDYLDEQKRRFETIMPELQKMQTLGLEDISVEVFKGKNTVRIALSDIISTLKNKGGEVLCTAVDESFALETNKTTVEQYERDILRYKIIERVILKKGHKGFLKRGNTKYAFIENKYFNPNPIIIYGEKVEILMWGSPNYLVRITSKNISDSFRKQYELMWFSSVKK
ncbi:MAG: winged helix-turn-helix transcriptional regulator [Nanoarchaeota archaeon]|nr:winged helix-turn-helix transcriptional regulator [Nanoarchaeota archaeon]MBU2443394.1 winged helix-turn-helix transcriptional regulator [Nanoarchaeota archaeon]